MRCPRCGREMSAAELVLVGTAFECQACLGCNHLFVRVNTAQTTDQALSRDKADRRGLDAPAIERCQLTPEEEAVARKLLQG